MGKKPYAVARPRLSWVVSGFVLLFLVEGPIWKKRKKCFLCQLASAEERDDDGTQWKYKYINI